MFCNCHTMESVWMGPADFRNASAMITRSVKSVKVTTTLNKQDYHATISFKYISFLLEYSGALFVAWNKNFDCYKNVHTSRR